MVSSNLELPKLVLISSGRYVKGTHEVNPPKERWKHISFSERNNFSPVSGYFRMSVCGRGQKGEDTTKQTEGLGGEEAKLFVSLLELNICTSAPLSVK